LPALDFAAHRDVCGLVARLIGALVGGAGVVPLSAVHDVSGGGLGVTLAEMMLAAGVGCTVALEDGTEMFSEAPSRFVLATGDPEQLRAEAAASGVSASVLGQVGGGRLSIEGLVNLGLDELSAAADGRLPALFGDT
jgi:phosphoribosylformylglycinamidine synthase